MKNLHRLFSVVLFAALAFAGCSDNNEDKINPDPEPGEVNFTLSVDGISKTGCRFTVVPADLRMPYIAMIIEQDELDGFASDQELIAADLADFREEAETMGVSLSELLINEYLQIGKVEETLTDELEPGTGYYLYAYGMNEEGEATTKLEKLLFRTEAVEQTEVAFDIRLTEQGTTSLTVAVSATPEDAAYFFSLMTEEEYGQYANDTEAVTADVAAIVEHYKRQGATLAQIYDGLSSHGNDGDTFTDLRPGSKFYVYAVGVNADFMPNSAPAVKMVETKAVKPSDNTFDVKIDAIRYNGVDGTVTPSNDDQYIWCFQTKADVDNCPDDYTAMEWLVESFKAADRLEELLHKGVSQIEVSYLQPETDYYLMVFGWDEAPTTALTKLPIRTVAGESDPSMLELEITVRDITYNEATADVVPNCGYPYFFDYIDADRYEELLAEMGKDAAVAQLVDESVSYLMDWYGMTLEDFVGQFVSIGPSTDFFSLEPGTRYVVFGASFDVKTGKVAYPKGFVSDIFETPEEVVSPANISFSMGKWYDGDDLANLDKDKYGHLAGCGILSYTIEPNGDAAHWYSNFYPGADYAEFDRDMLQIILVEYGYENPDTPNPDNVKYDSRSGYYVLPYDTAYSFISIAKDAEGAFGAGYCEVVTITKAGAAPGTEFPGLTEPAPLRRPSAAAPLRLPAARPHKVLR